MRHYNVEQNHGNTRLDQFLALNSSFSRMFVKNKLLPGGHVFVNHKKTTKASQKLSAGDEIIINPPSVKEVGILAENIPLDIVYEDAEVVVVNKPPNMVVHPTDHGAHVSGTLVNALMHHCREDLSGIGGEKRPGIVHRLDKDTSGLIMVAKNDRAHHSLSEQIQKRTITKKYLTLLKGHLAPKTGSIEAPLLKKSFDPQGKNVSVSKQRGSKYALTHYKVIDYIGRYSLVEVTIVTGRTHQIRVHFASIGHPVAGDKTYGDKKLNQEMEAIGLKRQFLHAWRLLLKLPGSEEDVQMEAPLAGDLKEVLKALRSK